MEGARKHDILMYVHIMVLLTFGYRGISADQSLTAVESLVDKDDTCKEDENIPQHPSVNIKSAQQVLFINSSTGSSPIDKFTTSPGMAVCDSASSKIDQNLPRDCTDILNRGNTSSGEYMISPQNSEAPFQVYCDMKTDGGGWTVFQRREDGSVDFYINWKDYETGFGNVNSEHWLGNTKIHRISAQGHYELRIDMTDFDGFTAYATYDNFRLGDAGTKFKLILGSFVDGNAGDSLSLHAKNSPFSTRDQENDAHPEKDCASAYRGAWWYGVCYRSNLNALYLGAGRHESHTDGINWLTWRGHDYSLKYTDMKIRRTS